VSTSLPAIIFLGGLPLLIVARLAYEPVSPQRLERFRRLYRLAPGPDETRLVTAYLAHTRRWRVLGATCGYVVGLVRALPEQKAELSMLAVAVGWLIGAVIAEFRYRAPGPADGPPPPAWLHRVPVVLAATAAALTMVMLVLGRATGPTVAVLTEGALAVGCAGLIVLTTRHIAGRPAAVGAPVPEVVQAVTLHSVSAITGVAAALALAFLAGQVAAMQPGYFDTVGAAVGYTAVLWALGGASIGWFLVIAARPDPRASGTPLRPVLVIVVVLSLLSAGMLGFAWWRDRSPFPASAVRATATVRVTDHKRFDRDVAAIGVTGLSLGQWEGPIVVGRLDYRLPAGVPDNSTFHVVVIDKRTNEVTRHLYNADGGGWSSALSALPRRYPWLSAMADTEAHGGYANAGMAVAGSAAEPGPITFHGSFSDAGSLTVDDIMVVLVFSGPDDQTYWAERVLG
jgi:hypothetical protein